MKTYNTEALEVTSSNSTGVFISISHDHLHARQTQAPLKVSTTCKLQNCCSRRSANPKYQCTLCHKFSPATNAPSGHASGPPPKRYHQPPLPPAPPLLDPPPKSVEAPNPPLAAWERRASLLSCSARASTQSSADPLRTWAAHAAARSAVMMYGYILQMQPELCLKHVGLPLD